MIVYRLFTLLFTKNYLKSLIVYWFTCALFTHVFLVNNLFNLLKNKEIIVYLAGKLTFFVYHQVNNPIKRLFTHCLLVNDKSTIYHWVL